MLSQRFSPESGRKVAAYAKVTISLSQHGNVNAEMGSLKNYEPPDSNVSIGDFLDNRGKHSYVATTGTGIDPTSNQSRAITFYSEHLSLQVPKPICVEQGLPSTYQPHQLSSYSRSDLAIVLWPSYPKCKLLAQNPLRRAILFQKEYAPCSFQRCPPGSMLIRVSDTEPKQQTEVII